VGFTRSLLHPVQLITMVIATLPQMLTGRRHERARVWGSLCSAATHAARPGSRPTSKRSSLFRGPNAQPAKIEPELVVTGKVEVQRSAQATGQVDAGTGSKADRPEERGRIARAHTGPDLHLDGLIVRVGTGVE
jgi:hypothetical protein